MIWVVILRPIFALVLEGGAKHKIPSVLYCSIALQWGAACWDPWWWWDEEIWFKTSHKGRAWAWSRVLSSILWTIYVLFFFWWSVLTVIPFFMTSIFIVNESSQPCIFKKKFMRCHGKLILPTTVNVMLSLLWGATLNYGDPLSWHSGMLEDLLQIVERKHGPGMCLVICGLNSSLFNFQWLNLGVTRCWDKSWQMLPNQTSNVQKFRSVKVACCSTVC